MDAAATYSPDQRFRFRLTRRSLFQKPPDTPKEIKMKKQNNHLTNICKIFFCGFLIFNLFTTLCAQEILERSSDKPSPAPRVPNSKQAKTSPVSKSKITLKITFDGEPFVVTQYEGATIRIERNGSTFGLIPYLDGDQVRIKAVKMSVITDGKDIIGEAISDLAYYEVSTEASVVNGTELGATIELLYVKRAHMTGQINDRFVPLLVEECCITCGGTTMCACAVGSNCGSCCVRGCGC
jgi:hypothetical protein